MSKSNVYFCVNVLILNCILLPCVFTSAKMARSAAPMESRLAPQTLDLNQVIEHLQTLKSTKSEGPSILDWATFAKEIIGLEKIISYQPLAVDKVTKQMIVEGIKAKLASSKWTKINNNNDLKKIKDWKFILKDKLNPNSLGWSWFLYQTGELKASKEILEKLFDAEFERVMKLKVVIVGLGGNPMTSIQNLEQKLVLVSTPHEKSDLKKKMQKAKVHIANLPESHVVT